MISWEDGEGPKHCCQQYVDELQRLAVMFLTLLVICQHAYKEKHLAPTHPSKTEHILPFKKRTWETPFVTNGFF